MVQQEKVFALFGYVGTPTLVKALPVLQKFSAQDLILFANFTGAQAQRHPPHKKNVFNIRRSGLDGVTTALKKHQLAVLAQASYKRGAHFDQSMLMQHNILKQKNVQVIISIGSYAACAAFIRDARLAGFSGPIVNVSFVGSDSMLKLLQVAQKNHKIKLTNKLINTQEVPPWNDSSIPLVKKYQSIMQKYASALPEKLKDKNYTPLTYSFVSLEGFLNAMVLVKALKLSPKNINRKIFIQSIESLNDIDIGTKEKLNFSAQKHQGLDAVYFTSVATGKYKIIKQWDKFKP